MASDCALSGDDLLGTANTFGFNIEFVNDAGKACAVVDADPEDETDKNEEADGDEAN
jgi:hypothetical protein